MMAAFWMFVASLLFLAGLRLSAFFSGSETGFYRISVMKLTLMREEGDHVARRLMQFIEHPERFVATTLVGNNIANYLTTVAIGLMLAATMDRVSGAAELTATILMTPVIFVFGELIPKSLYFRAPMSLLRGGSYAMHAFYILFLPVSLPLIILSRFISRFAAQDSETAVNVMLGRSRLNSVFAAGRKEGLLTEMQSQLAENLIGGSSEPVIAKLIPAGSLSGLPQTASRDEILAYAHRMHSPRVLLHEPDQPKQWTQWIRVADLLAMPRQPASLMRPLPKFQAETPALEALVRLYHDGAPYGIIATDGVTIGIVTRRSLIAPLMRRDGGPRSLAIAGIRSGAEAGSGRR